MGGGQKKSPMPPFKGESVAKGKPKNLMGVPGLKNRAKTGAS
jgi:hypothetical protein